MKKINNFELLKAKSIIAILDGDTFEELRSLEQELTFDVAERAFKMYSVEFNREKYRALGMVQSKDDIFTNLALLLSDQCRKHKSFFQAEQERQIKSF